jgi:TonB family protein
VAVLDGPGGKGSNKRVGMSETGGVGGAGGAGGAGISTDSGPAFPYPWYLKAIADKLNAHWKPPKDFQEDTLCQIAFVINRDGQVSDTKVEQPSGDSTFDQLAQRAVLYANPLPPLPSGFPEDALRVHMKFVGKSQ